MTARQLLQIAIAVTVVACAGGESHFDRQPALERQIDDMCDEWKQWKEGCGEDPSGFYEACVADPRWDYVWDEAVLALEQCFLELACTETDDICFERILDELGVTPSADALYLACLDKAAMCAEVLDDDCGALLIYHDGSRDRIESCLPLSCAEFDACLQDPLP
jgi:hypothetical protein